MLHTLFASRRRVASRAVDQAPKLTSPPSPVALLERYGVETIFDIGANVGMSAESYRTAGFHGPIVSFEPVPSLYAELLRRSQSDPLWRVVPLALGGQCGHADIHVTGGHAGATSLLTMTENVVKHAPDQAVLYSQRIE